MWTALDANTRQVVAGQRDVYTAERVWGALPDEYRGRAVTCTDRLEAYQAVIPDDRHARAGKAAGRTCRLERFRATVRARCARFVRKTPSFSECECNHVRTLWDFIRQYNASRA